MFPCPGIQSMEPYASACDNTELSNGKKPLSEREMVSVLCFSPVACEEGEIIDCSFYHKECVCMCILVISVTHNQCISLKEKAKEWCLRTPPGPHMPPTDWSFTRLWHASRLQNGRSAPGFHRTHQSPSRQLCLQRWGQHRATKERRAVGGHCLLQTSTAASWLLVVSVFSTCSKVSASAERVSSQSYVCINWMF